MSVREYKGRQSSNIIIVCYHYEMVFCSEELETHAIKRIMGFRNRVKNGGMSVKHNPASFSNNAIATDFFFSLQLSCPATVA